MPCHFCELFPIPVFTDLSLQASLFTPCQRYPLTSYEAMEQATQCHCQEGSRVQDTQGQAFQKHCFIPAPSLALETPYRSHHKVGWGGQEPIALSSLPGETPGYFHHCSQ